MSRIQPARAGAERTVQLIASLDSGRGPRVRQTVSSLRDNGLTVDVFVACGAMVTRLHQRATPSVMVWVSGCESETGSEALAALHSGAHSSFDSPHTRARSDDRYVRCRLHLEADR